MRDLLEAARRVEARGQFVGERLVVDKAVGAGRADGLFVEAHRLKIAAFDAGDLRAHQGGAVLEILRAVRRPDFELTVVGGHSLEMLPALVGLLRNRRTPRGRARHKSDTPPSRTVMAEVHKSRCAVEAAVDGGGIVASKEARLQLSDPVPALG